MRTVAALLVAAMLAACGAADEGASGARRDAPGPAAAAGNLRRHIDQVPRTLDPSLSTDVAAQRIIDDLFEGLVRVDPAGKVVPGVATKWEMSGDGTRYTFHLRADARWSNGEPVTAEDFVFAWRRTVDPRTAAEYAQALAPLRGATDVAAGRAPVETLGVAALDAHTLEVRLASPTAYFLWLLTNPFLYPQHAATLARHGDRWTRPGNLVSNGAFVLQASVLGGAVTLARNPHYWDAGAVTLRQVTYYAVPDRTVAAARYLAGDLDVVDSVSPNDQSRLAAQLGSQLRVAPYFGTLMFGVHLGRPPFAGNRALRQALTMSIDREIIAHLVLKDVVLPAYNLVPPLEGYPQVRPAWAALSDEQRHALARQRYAEAGYSAEQPLRVELSYPTSSTDIRRLLEALAAMWRTNLGAEVQLANQEWRVLQQERRLGKVVLYWWSWIGDYPDPQTLLGLLRAGGSQNFGGYRNEAFERLVGEGEVATDEAARFAKYAAAEQVLNEDVPFVPIYFYKSRTLVKPYVLGFADNPLNRHLSRDLRLATAVAQQ